MIHQPSGGARDRQPDPDRSGEYSSYQKKKLNEIRANTGQPYDVIVRDTGDNYMMTAEQAKEYGLIDCVITNH